MKVNTPSSLSNFQLGVSQRGLKKRQLEDADVSLYTGYEILPQRNRLELTKVILQHSTSDMYNK